MTMVRTRTTPRAAWFTLILALAVNALGGTAHAGVIITDGRVGKPASSGGRPSLPCDRQQLTETEQAIFILTSMIFYGHDAVLEQTSALPESDEGSVDVGDNLYAAELLPPEGCSAASPGALGASLLAAVLMTLRQRQSARRSSKARASTSRTPAQ